MRACVPTYHTVTYVVHQLMCTLQKRHQELPTYSNRISFNHHLHLTIAAQSVKNKKNYRLTAGDSRLKATAFLRSSV